MEAAAPGEGGPGGRRGRPGGRANRMCCGGVWGRGSQWTPSFGSFSFQLLEPRKGLVLGQEALQVPKAWGSDHGTPCPHSPVLHGGPACLLSCPGLGGLTPASIYQKEKLQEGDGAQAGCICHSWAPAPLPGDDSSGRKVRPDFDPPRWLLVSPRPWDLAPGAARCLATGPSAHQGSTFPGRTDPLGPKGAAAGSGLDYEAPGETVGAPD